MKPFAGLCYSHCTHSVCTAFPVLQGLKVFEDSDIDPKKFKITSGKKLKRKGKVIGKEKVSSMLPIKTD